MALLMWFGFFSSWLLVDMLVGLVGFMVVCLFV